jgi:hypothetical protein
MNKTLFAAMSGVAFGLVLAVSGYHVASHLGCQRTEAPTFVRIERVAPRPCARFSTPPIVMVQDDPPIATPTTSPVDIDATADRYLLQAQALASSDPKEARTLCRKTMQLYHNNPRNVRVRLAFRLMNRIVDRHDEDDD